MKRTHLSACLIAITFGCSGCATVNGARPEAVAAEEVRMIVDHIAHGSLTTEQLAAKLGARSEPQAARGKGTSMRSPLWRIEVKRQTEDEKSPVAEVTFYPEAPLRLALGDLSALGTWKLIRQSKTSTVRFDYGQLGAAAVVVYVELKFPPNDLRSPVVWVRVRLQS